MGVELAAKSTNDGIGGGIVYLHNNNNYNYQYLSKLIRYLVGALINIILTYFKTP